MNHVHNPRPVASCLTCLYFRHLEMGSGCCHRYPPSFAGDTSPKEAHHWRFPVVGGHSWCGEHRALPERPPSQAEYAPE